MRIYDSDREVYGHSTNIKALSTKSEIDGILARYGIKDILWHYDPDNNDVTLSFKLSEKFGAKEQSLTVQISPPIIWHIGPNKKESINWNASMRNMYWYIWTHLSQAYVNQSSKFQEFLPHILNREGKKLIEVAKQEFVALPEEIPERVVNP